VTGGNPLLQVTGVKQLLTFVIIAAAVFNVAPAADLNTAKIDQGCVCRA
jgi:hypothetical protein